jgi:hypothetical protein
VTPESQNDVTGTACQTWVVIQFCRLEAPAGFVTQQFLNLDKQVESVAWNLRGYRIHEQPPLPIECPLSRQELKSMMTGWSGVPAEKLTLLGLMTLRAGLGE